MANGGDARGFSNDIFAKIFLSLTKTSEPEQAKLKANLKLEQKAYIGSYQNMDGIYKVGLKGNKLSISFHENGGK